MCVTEGFKPVTQNMCASRGLKGLRAQQMQVVARHLESCDGNCAYQQELLDLSFLRNQSDGVYSST